MLGKWWDVLIKFIIPAILIVLLIMSVINNVTKNPYPSYPGWLVVLFGIGPLIIITGLSFVLMKIKGKEAEAT